MKHIKVSAVLLACLETTIIEMIQDRIKSDPDVEDTYLRISTDDDLFALQIMYLEESNLTSPNNDIALLNLMYDTEQSVGQECWVPDVEAIHNLAHSYADMTNFNVCLY